MNITDEKIDKIKDLIETNMIDFHNYEYKSYIEDYKSYIGDVSDRLLTKDKWQMNMSYPLAFMMVDTVFGTVFDFDYQLKIKSKKLETACIDAYDFKSYGKQTLGMSSKEGLITGTGIMRDYTYMEEGKYEAFGEKIDYQIKSPTMEYISVFNIMYDRMKGLNDSNYKIVRQFLSESDIRSKVLSSIKQKDLKKKAENKVKSLKDTENNAFSMYNYEAIKGLIFSSQFIDSVTDKKGKLAQGYKTNVDSASSCKDLNYNRNDQMSTMIKNSPYYNDFDYKYEVVEVLEGMYKHTFVNGTHILSEEVNPHIYNIVAVEYNRIPGSGKSIGIPRIIKQLADSSNGLMNMFLDSLKLSNTLIFKKKNGLPGKAEKLKIESGQILTGDLQRIDLGGGDFSGMNGVQALQGIAQSTLGINQLIMGGDSRVQRIAGAFDFTIAQYKARLTPFTDSINIAMSKIIKGWISQYISMYSEDELYELYEIKIEKIKTKGIVTDITIDDIAMSDILNENNISFKFESMSNLKKESEKKTALDIFQLAQQYNNSKVDAKEFIKLLAGDQDASLEKVLGIEKEYDELDNIDDINIDEVLGGLETSKKDLDTNTPEEDLEAPTDEITNEETPNLEPNLL